MAKIIGNTTATTVAQPDWNQTDPTKVSYIKNKPDSFAGGGRTNIHNEGIFGADGKTIDEIFASATPDGGYISGDTFTIKTLISGDKYVYTGYVYNGTDWKAMDGNYNAENVYFDEDIIITTAVGNIDVVSGSGTIPSSGKNLKEVFELIWTKESEPSVTLPAVTINTDVQYQEVGATVTPSYSVSLSAGSYSYGPATGITAKSWYVECGREIKSVAAGTFSDIVVAEGNCCDITATAGYDNGSIPVTNLGNACPNKQIKAGFASAVKNIIVGYKPNFYGFKTASIKIDDIDSDTVRALGVDQKQTTTPLPKVSSSTPWLQFFYALPKGRKTTLSVKDSNGLPLTVQTKEVTVAHNGTASSVYTVFYINNDAAYGATTLTLTWS